LTSQQILAKRIELLEMRLLMSPMLSQSDCAIVMELVGLVRQRLNAPKADPPKRVTPFSYFPPADML